jgi:2-polyprenyl-3-methyl-5-hydroxy-6-metoxy-1,4-benzoquinol methylase
VLEHQRPKHGDADRDEIRDRVVRLRHGVYPVGKELEGALRDRVEEQRLLGAEVVTPSFEAYEGSGPENYERYFVPAIGAPLAGDLVDVAGISAGDRVLDAACGTGVVARRAAERLLPGGSVTGLDVNPGMLAVARSVSETTQAPIEWRHASADATTPASWTRRFTGGPTSCASPRRPISSGSTCGARRSRPPSRSSTTRSALRPSVTS